MTKYKIHDFILDAYYPGSKEIFFPTPFAVNEGIDLIIELGTIPEQLEVYIYEDWAFFEHPSDILLVVAEK